MSILTASGHNSNSPRHYQVCLHSFNPYIRVWSLLQAFQLKVSIHKEALLLGVTLYVILIIPPCLNPKPLFTDMGWRFWQLLWVSHQICPTEQYSRQSLCGHLASGCGFFNQYSVEGIMSVNSDFWGLLMYRISSHQHQHQGPIPT